jgi:hypothetical protein
VYTFAHDEAQSLAVWAVDKLTPDEWGQHCDHMRQVARWSTTTQRRAAIIIIPGNAFDRPDAVRRAELTRLTNAPGYDPFLALITPNVAARGIVTLFKWVQTKPRWVLETFPDTVSGLVWLEECRGEALPALHAMTADVMIRARRAGLRAACK